MVLLAHITIALLSLIQAAYTYIAPTRAKIGTAYALAAMTLASGTYLVVSSSGSHLAEACMTGIIYLGTVSLGITAAHRKLAGASVRIRKSHEPPLQP